MAIDRARLRRHVASRWRHLPPSPALFIALGPAYLRHGLSALLIFYQQRRSGEPVQDRSHARERQRAARRRPVGAAQS